MHSLDVLVFLTPIPSEMSILSYLKGIKFWVYLIFRSEKITFRWYLISLFKDFKKFCGYLILRFWNFKIFDRYLISGCWKIKQRKTCF